MYGNYTRFILNRQAELRAERYAKWAREFDALMVAAHPELRGRQDWDMARYLYSQDKTPEQAARIAGAAVKPEARASEAADIANGCLP